METLGDRIRKARGERSQDVFCAMLGISKGSLGFYERNENMPRLDVAAKICSLTGVSLAWLANGTGPMREAGRARPAEESGLVSLPLVEARVAGSGLAETGERCELPASLAAGRAKGLVVMRADGDSMAPEIMDGDKVLLDTGKRDVRLGRLYAVGIGGAAYLKRVDMLPGRAALRCVNPAYETLEISARDGFLVLGQVIWIGRNY